MRIKPGGVRAGIDFQQEYVEHPVQGLVATDGVVRSAVITVGTTAVEIQNWLVDPGFSLQLKEFYVGLTQRFTGLNGSFVGSLIYYWQAREEFVDISGQTPTLRASAYINISGTYQKSIGTLVAVEDSFTGYVPVGSVPHAPVRMRLMAIDGVRASSLYGDVKNSSVIKLIGNIIPGA